MDAKLFTIDLGERFTRMTDTRYQGGQVELLAMGYKDTIPFFYSTENPDLIDRQAEIITQLAANLRIRKKEVNVIVPDAYTFSQIIEMPQLKEKELLAAIRYQADEFIPMPIEETTLDIEILSENPATKKLLLFIAASPKKIIERVKKTVEKARLMPLNLENELSAVGKISGELFKKIPHQPGTASILVNFGFTQTSLYLLDHASSLLVLVRAFKIGLDLFMKEVKVNLNINDQQAYEAIRSQDPERVKSVVSIISPGLKEFNQEIERFMLLTRERYNLTTSNIYIYNLDGYCPTLFGSLKGHFSIPVENFPINSLVSQNTIASSFASTMSSFISVIGGSLA